MPVCHVEGGRLHRSPDPPGDCVQAERADPTVRRLPSAPITTSRPSVLHTSPFKVCPTNPVKSVCFRNAIPPFSELSETV